MLKCNSTTPSLSSNLVLKAMQQDVTPAYHGRFHGMLPKEYSGTFHWLPWGLYKEMPTNTQGQSDISIHKSQIRRVNNSPD